MSSPERTPRLPSLDGMRGIAAIGVLLYHAHNAFGITTFTRGYLCVDYFFLLSGFVLARSAEPHLDDGPAARRFLRGRLRRLWPMIAVGVILGVVGTNMAGAPLLLTILLGASALTMIPWLWSPAQLYPMNGPQWSLLLELGANGVHAFVLHRLGTRVLIVATLAMGLLLGRGTVRTPSGLTRPTWRLPFRACSIPT